MSVIDYFWPRLPNQISAESTDALSKDVKERGAFNLKLSDEHRASVDVWVRGKDRNARRENREWIKKYALTFTKRWGALSAALWFLAWLVSGNYLLAEIPLTLLAVISGVIAIVFFYAHKKLNEPNSTLE